MGFNESKTNGSAGRRRPAQAKAQQGTPTLDSLARDLTKLARENG